jgi:hypothetical protein
MVLSVCFSITKNEGIGLGRVRANNINWLIKYALEGNNFG